MPMFKKIASVFKLASVCFIAMYVFTACIPKVDRYVGKLNCNMSQEEIRENILQILQEEGYTIKFQSNDSIFAHTDDFTTWNGYEAGVQFNINIKQNEIVSNANLCVNVNGVISFASLSDNTREDIVQYWNIRKKLEELCANLMVVEVDGKIYSISPESYGKIIGESLVEGLLDVESSSSSSDYNSSSGSSQSFSSTNDYSSGSSSKYEHKTSVSAQNAHNALIRQYESQIKYYENKANEHSRKASSYESDAKNYSNIATESINKARQ